jgi:Ca2+-binding EF-hand superfamily protein
MDRDGGGTMDRKELAVALLQLGVWLHPKEIAILMDALDGDGSGEIDEEEFIVFWNATVNLDQGLESRGNSREANRGGS